MALRLERTLCIDDAATERAEPEACELMEPLRLNSESTSLCEVCSSSCDMLLSSSSTSMWSDSENKLRGTANLSTSDHFS